MKPKLLCASLGLFLGANIMAKPLLETVKVKADNDRGFRFINKSEYDKNEDDYTLVEDKIVTPKAEETKPELGSKARRFVPGKDAPGDSKELEAHAKKYENTNPQATVK